MRIGRAKAIEDRWRTRPNAAWVYRLFREVGYSPDTIDMLDPQHASSILRRLGCEAMAAALDADPDLWYSVAEIAARRLRDRHEKEIDRKQRRLVAAGGQ